MSILKKRKRSIGEKFPMTRSLAQIREELKQKPLSSKQHVPSQSGIVSADDAERVMRMNLFKHALAVPLPENKADVGEPGDGLVQPLPGDREPMFL